MTPNGTKKTPNFLNFSPTLNFVLKFRWDGRQERSGGHTGQETNSYGREATVGVVWWDAGAQHKVERGN